MPHIVIEYSSGAIDHQKLDETLKTCFDALCTFDCIRPKAVKLRAHPILNAYYGNGAQSYVHVTAHLLEGRTTKRKSEISKTLLDTVMKELPEIDTFSVDVLEIEGAVYQKNK